MRSGVELGLIGKTCTGCSSEGFKPNRAPEKLLSTICGERLRIPIQLGRDVWRTSRDGGFGGAARKALGELEEGGREEHGKL